MILNDCVVFYHASQKENIRTIIPKKEVSNTHHGKVTGKYACLASSPAQAFYWANVLGKGKGTWYIYEVRLPHTEIVENCDGGYHFEGVGEITEAVNITDHENNDGEVCVFHPVPVTGVYAVVHFQS